MTLVEIGYFSKTHGIKGALHLKININFDNENVDAVFTDTNLGKVPHFIKTIKHSNTGLIFELEEIDTVESAKKLIGHKVFIKAEFIIETENDSWLGYELIDNKLGSLGKIIEETDNGYQTLVTVIFRSKSIDLPLADDLIESIDDNTKIIKYSSPEGLIEMNFEEK